MMLDWLPARRSAIAAPALREDEMDRPQPKELVVTLLPLYSPSSTPALKITVASEDARRWVEREAPAFGKFYPPTEDRPWFMLYIADAYAAAEVAAYLQSYNESVTEES
jgi:hypothetical protein